ncbi:hypothetical protein ACROYT_G041551 [Oculina patagonica]
MLERTLKSLNKVVDFYGREFRKFNIDGIFGLQALDGILQDLLIKVQTNQIQMFSETFRSLNQLHNKATLVASQAQPFLNASDPDYYRLGFVARHAWHFTREFRNLDTSLSRLIPQESGNFVSAMMTMDQCISDLIGDQRTGAAPCRITDKCWKFIRSENTTGYMTTHQALYFMVGEVKGCEANITERLFKSHREGAEIIENIFESLCASIYKQVKRKELILRIQRTSRDTGDQDLYMEQCYVCGILGYQKFLSLDRLSVILDWQLPLGCYGSNEYLQDEDREKEDSVKDGEDWDFSELADKRLRTRDLSQRRTRQAANVLPGGCERHITGVATGLLGVYLKWLLAVPSLENILM